MGSEMCIRDSGCSDPARTCGTVTADARHATCGVARAEREVGLDVNHAMRGGPSVERGEVELLVTRRCRGRRWSRADGEGDDARKGRAEHYPEGSSRAHQSPFVGAARTLRRDEDADKHARTLILHTRTSAHAMDMRHGTAGFDAADMSTAIDLRNHASGCRGVVLPFGSAQGAQIARAPASA